MQAGRAKGAAPVPSKKSPTVPVTDDEIREKYLERAIRELNHLTHELQDCPHCPRGKLMPVLGSGHPQADVFMVKHSPRRRRDRRGRRLLRPARQRADEKLQAAGDRPAGRLRDALRQVPDRRARPGRRRVLAAAGRGARDRAAENRRRHGRACAARPQPPRSAALTRGRAARGEIQTFTPTIDALYTPDIDESLDEEGAKQRFWRTFKTLGEWYEDLPPY